jgi:tripartite ATP-independent transporter DctM subunit
LDRWSRSCWTPPPEQRRVVHPPPTVDGSVPDIEIADEVAASPVSDRPRHWFFAHLDTVLFVVIGAALFGELLAVLANVVGRAFFHYSFLWTDEVGRLVLSILAFVGGAVAYRLDYHSAVHTIVDALPQPYRGGCHALTDWLVVLVALVTGYLSISLLTSQMGMTTPILDLPAWSLVAPLFIGMGLLIVYAAERLYRHDRRTVLWTGAVVACVVVLLVASRDMWAPAVSSNAAITAALLLFFVTVLIGFPVGFALIFSTLIDLYPSASTPFVALPQILNDGMGFVLLALPFFILAGAIMEQGGISTRLVGFARDLVGHFKGGLLQVTVVSIYLVSGLSGSKAADVAAVGPVMKTMLKREGISLEEGAAVLAASAAMGETIPPSLGLLVLGSITTLSMGALFAAGLIPAAVIAVCLMVLIFFRAHRTNMPRSRRATAAERWRSAAAAILPILMPVSLYVGVRMGIATPTEISAVAVAYGILLAVLVYRAFGVHEFVKMIGNASVVAGMILFILAAANAFTWVLSAAQVPQALVSFIETWHGSSTVFLVVSALALVVLGSLLEGLPAILILAPLLLPVAVKLGLNELHYAIVLLVAIGIGAFLPPLGVGFYVSCSVAGTKMGPTTRVMVPYALVLLIGLMIVAFVPWFTLVLPEAFSGK